MTRVPVAHRMAHHRARHTHPQPSRYYGSHAGAVPRTRGANTPEDVILHLQANFLLGHPDQGQATQTVGNPMTSQKNPNPFHLQIQALSHGHAS